MVKFEKCLKSFDLLKEKALSIPAVIYWPGNQDLEGSLAHYLAEHLNMAGISTTIKSEIIQVPSHSNTVICFLPPEGELLPFFLEKDSSSNNVLLLLSDSSASGQWTKEFNCIELTRQKNYYFLVFEILKKIFPDSPFLEKGIAEFQRETEEVENSSAFLPSEISQGSVTIKQAPDFDLRVFLRNPRYLVLLSLLTICVTSVLVFLIFKYFEGGGIFVLNLNAIHTRDQVRLNRSYGIYPSRSF